MRKNRTNPDLIDKDRRKYLVIRAKRWSSAKVIEALADVTVMKGVPEHPRRDEHGWALREAA